MKIKIHRGSSEIGGSCVEVIHQDNRIIIDIGMPLVADNGEKYNHMNYKELSGPELLTRGILPDVKGLYSWDKDNKRVDALLLSHPHQDHYGFMQYIDKDVPVYLGQAARKIIDLTVLFTPLEGKIKNPVYIESGESFNISSFTITPYLMDHSAFDAYAFLIQAGDKTVLYSGDFREHGRKNKAFYWFLHNIPDKIDALLLEGTSFGRDDNDFMTEADVEDKMIEISADTEGIVLFQQSSQNIDRIVSFYRAALQSNRFFVIDFYTANILSILKDYANTPYPSRKFSKIKVFYPYYLSKRIVNQGDENLLYRFKDYKITKEEIADRASEIMMLVRPSMLSDLRYINSFDDASFVYSLWDGYLQEDSMKGMLEFIKDNNIDFHRLHTSGHASIKTLNKVVNRLNPRKIIPIHTFYPEKFNDLYENVLNVSDGKEIFILCNLTGG